MCGEYRRVPASAQAICRTAFPAPRWVLSLRCRAPPLPMIPSKKLFPLLIALIVGSTCAQAQLPAAAPAEPPPAAGDDASPVTLARTPAKEPKGPPPTKKKLEQLAAKLNDDEFKVRESAQIELGRLAKAHPDASLDTLLERYLDASLPEARYRLRSILYNTKYAEFMEVPPGFVGIVMNPSPARGGDGQFIHTVQVMRVVPDSAAERHGTRALRGLADRRRGLRLVLPARRDVDRRTQAA